MNAGPAVYISPSGPNPLMVQVSNFMHPNLFSLHYAIGTFEAENMVVGFSS